MMKKYTGEIIKLRAIDVLSGLAKIIALPYIADGKFRKGAFSAIEELGYGQATAREKIKYLKRMGFIETFVEGKESFFEITPKGIEKLNERQKMFPTIKRPKKWDGKWRIVIFDIPDKRKSSRDVLRRKLLLLGFIKIQESVYVYPFECTEVVMSQSAVFDVSQYVLVMISDIIQGEEQIINTFLEKGVLTKDDLSPIQSNN